MYPNDNIVSIEREREQQMNVKEAIMGRRSVRKYKKTPIREEDIREILEAGIMAPSASNLQPWYFVAVREGTNSIRSSRPCRKFRKR